MIGNGRIVLLGALAALALAGANPVSAEAIDLGKQTGPQGLKRMLAAEATNPSAELELRIAEIYGPGPADIGPGGMPKGSLGPDGVPVDYHLAMAWLRRAARHCHDGAASQAQFQIGDLYAYGAGVRRDKVEALTWYLISTDVGTSGLRGEYVEGMRDETTRAEQHEATRRARNYVADARRRCGR
jgi:TPR repeat protein